MAMIPEADQGWTLLAGVLVFFMQAGFAMLEAGSVRQKNFQVVVMKNIMDASIGAISWMLVGYGLAFGTLQGDGSYSWLGTDHFVVTAEQLTYNADTGVQTGWYMWFFQFTFCATAATIVGGAVAERCKLEGYLLFTIYLCSFVYPLVVHWCWNGGWLTQEGYSDFAGSGVVHMVGGVTALGAAAVLGPRIGRFDDNKTDDEIAHEFRPASRVYICLGTFILWFGWYGFNAGSTIAIEGISAQDAARCMTTTTLAAAGGGVVAFILGTKLNGRGRYDMVSYANGILAGLVSVTAGCNDYDAGPALILGALGGIVYIAASKMVEKSKIDDPIGAFAVHGACGAWGVICVGLFGMGGGVFYGNQFSDQLGPNLMGCAVIAAWSLGTTVPFFMGLKFLGLLRTTPEEEEHGLDYELVGVDKSDDKSRLV